MRIIKDIFRGVHRTDRHLSAKRRNNFARGARAGPLSHHAPDESGICHAARIGAATIIVDKFRMAHRVAQNAPMILAWGGNRDGAVLGAENIERTEHGGTVAGGLVSNSRRASIDKRWSRTARGSHRTSQHRGIVRPCPVAPHESRTLPERRERARINVAHADANLVALAADGAVTAMIPPMLCATTSNAGHSV